MKEQIKQEVIWPKQTQCTHGILHFWEQLFSVMFSAKYVHCLLGIADKVGESSKLKNMVLKEIEDIAN